MKKFIDFMGDQTCPVIEFRHRPRYVNGIKTDILDSVYTILHSYEQIPITVEGHDETAVTPEQIKIAADAGSPIEMMFKDMEITIQGTKNPWEIRPTGRASQATIAKSK